MKGFPLYLKQISINIHNVFSELDFMKLNLNNVIHRHISCNKVHKSYMGTVLVRVYIFVCNPEIKVNVFNI